MNETLQLVLQAGALGILVLLLVGIGYGAFKVGPLVASFLTNLVKEQAANREALVALSAKIDASNAAMMARIELAETRMKSFVDAAAGGIEDTVRENVSATGEHVEVTVDRAVALLRSSPDSDLPPAALVTTTRTQATATRAPLRTAARSVASLSSAAIPGPPATIRPGGRT